ncbi:MAG TPA: hypothetical protein VNC82_19410 [Candidatus Limnocylindria bacterium]|nr:hypothetical protein [Candidatus Limnocylindria bacterium]
MLRTMRHALQVTLIALVASPASAGWSQTLDLTAEIAHLRARLAANSAQEQHCLADATRPVWTAALATDLQALRARASQAAAEGVTADAQRWRELARKAEALEARTTTNARTGAELFQSQQIGLDCLDRFAAEREALRASLEIAVADPALRAAEALVAAADAWNRERVAIERLSAAGDDAEHRKTAMERDEAARQARDYWAGAEQLLGRRGLKMAAPTRGTASPASGGTP